MASANSPSTHETDPSRVLPSWDSTEIRVAHNHDLAYYLSPEDLDSLGLGVQRDAVCYVPTDESKRVYFAITGTNLKHPGGTTIWPADLSGGCDESKASMMEYKTGQFGQVDTVTYKGYTRPDTGRKVERTFRSDRKLPTDQTARQQVGETAQGTPIWSFIHHWDCKLVKVNDDSSYADADAPVTSLSGLYPGQTLWSAAGRVISEAPFSEYRSSEVPHRPACRRETGGRAGEA